MSQPSTRESLTPSLKPALQAALASMDVQLDAELARYRRQSKKSKPFSPTSSPGDNAPSGTAIVEGKIQMPPSPPKSEPQTPPSHENEPVTEATPRQPELPPTPTAPAVAAATTDSSKIASGSQSETTGLAAADADRLSPTQNASEPKDYLESSEKLLDSTNEKNTPNSEESPSASWLSPLTIGTGLLLLLATATFGYVVFKPASLDRFLGKKNSTTTSAPTPTDSQTPDEVPKLPSAPDLSRQEFKELDLDNLGSINPSPSPRPIPTASPPATPVSPAPSRPGSVNPNSLGNLEKVLEPNANDPNATQGNNSQSATPAPSPTATPSQNPTQGASDLPKPPIDEDDRYYNFYFVVVNYDSPTWDQAKQVVPDAYLRKFPVGERIQMGAFDTTQEAQQLVDLLKEQGVEAEVYQP